MRSFCHENRDIWILSEVRLESQRDKLGKGLLNYRHPPTGGLSPDLPIAFLQVPYVASRKFAQVLVGWLVCRRNVLATQF